MLKSLTISLIRGPLSADSSRKYSLNVFCRAIEYLPEEREIEQRRLEPTFLSVLIFSREVERTSEGNERVETPKDRTLSRGNARKKGGLTLQGFSFRRVGRVTSEENG